MVVVAMFKLTAVGVEARFGEGDWMNIKKKTALNVHGSAITVSMKQHMTTTRTIHLFVPNFQFSAPTIVNKRGLSEVNWMIILSAVLCR